MSAREDCYRLIQQIVVRRDVFCQWPSCSQRSAAGHHLFKRDRLGTSFLPEAVIGLCVDHHVPQVVSSEEFRDLMVKRMGERYYELQRLSNAVVKHFDFGACRRHLRTLL